MIGTQCGLSNKVGQIVLIVISSLLMFVTANEQSLWTHEIVTVGDSDIRVGLGYRDAQMPLTYILIFLSRVFIGSYDMAYRLPILLLSFALIQLIPWVLKKEGIDSVTTWIAPYLLLLTPKFIYYSQEARAWMPMAVCVIYWGAFRHISRWKGWLLCTIALQSSTLALIYVSTVVGIDWGYYIWKKSEKPQLAPVIALITHIPSVVFMFYISKSAAYASHDLVLTKFQMGNIFHYLFSINDTIDYLLRSYQFFFDGPKFVWFIIMLFSGFILFQYSTPFKRFWIGIIGGLIINAHFFISIRLMFLNPKYLILILPMLCIVPFLYQWKHRIVSITVALALVLAAHLTPIIEYREAAAKINRGYKSKPWEGIIPQVFARTANALIYPQRSDWKRLTLLFKSFVKPGDTVLFKNCDSCHVHPFKFYDRNFPETIRVKGASDDEDCSNWVVSTQPLNVELNCGLSLIIRLDRFYVYGKTEISIQQPIRYSRRLE